MFPVNTYPIVDGKVDFTRKREWDPQPDCCKGKHVRVYYHLKVKGFEFNGSSWEWDSEDAQAAAFAQALEVMKKYELPHGTEFDGYLDYLCWHPLTTCGVVPMEKVKEIGADLDACENISVVYAEVFQEISTISDADALRLLMSQRHSIETELLNRCRARRKTAPQDRYGRTAAENTARLYHVPRRKNIHSCNDYVTRKYIDGVLRDLVKEGFIEQFTDRFGLSGYRTVIPAKKDQKALREACKELEEENFFTFDELRSDRDYLGFRVVEVDVDAAILAIERKGLKWQKQPGRKFILAVRERQ